MWIGHECHILAQQFLYLGMRTQLYMCVFFNLCIFNISVDLVAICVLKNVKSERIN